jgi:type II secretory pathway pseudopilin PulG
MRRAGFTLMELVIVIGIIMLLMGLLFPAFNMVRRQAQKAKCRTLIHQVEAACDHYRNLNGTYPDSAVIASKFPLSGGPPPTPPLVSAVAEPDWAIIADELLQRLKTVDRDNFAAMAALNDPWGKPLHYRPTQYYPFLATAAHEVDKDPPPHPDSFQLWSIGVDEQDGYGDATSDDISNWSK